MTTPENSIRRISPQLARPFGGVCASKTALVKKASAPSARAATHRRLQPTLETASFTLRASIICSPLLSCFAAPFGTTLALFRLLKPKKLDRVLLQNHRPDFIADSDLFEVSQPPVRRPASHTPSVR